MQKEQYPTHLQGPLGRAGDIIIVSQLAKNCNTGIRFQFRAFNLRRSEFLRKPYSFFTIHREQDDAGNYQLVYKSPVAPNSTDPVWPLVELDLDSIGVERHLKIEIFNRVKHCPPYLIGLFNVLIR